MKNLNIALSLVLLIAGSAHAAPSRLIGTWATGCEAFEGGSYISKSIVQENGIMLSVTQSFLGTRCEGTPSEEKESAEYKIIEDTLDHTDISIVDPAPKEGELSDATLRFIYLNERQAVAKLLKGATISNGVRIELPQVAIDGAPVANLTKL